MANKSLVVKETVDTPSSGEITEIQKNVTRLFKKKTPKEVIKYRRGSKGMMFPYIPIDYVVTELDRSFGIFWEFIIDQFEEKSGSVICQGHLLIKSPTGFSISRPGVGRAEIKQYKDGSGSVDIGNDYKAAQSDALKKAASLFGIGADVYYKEIEKYDALEDAGTREEEEKAKAMSRFFAVAADKGYDAEYAKNRVKGIYGVEHMEDLTAEQLNRVSDKIEREKKRDPDQDRPPEVVEQAASAVRSDPDVRTCQECGAQLPATYAHDICKDCRLAAFIAQGKVKKAEEEAQMRIS